jgi:hypothetical protein
VKFANADCRVFTYKDGLLSPFGHDLELRVTRFTIEENGGVIEARFSPDGFEVVNATGGAVPLLPRDRASIPETIEKEILRKKEILFRSTQISDAEIRGTLTIGGRSREIVCKHQIDGTRHTASARVHQPDFGITPYRAMLGALRLKPDIDVTVSLDTGT